RPPRRYPKGSPPLQITYPNSDYKGLSMLVAYFPRALLITHHRYIDCNQNEPSRLMKHRRRLRRGTGYPASYFRPAVAPSDFIQHQHPPARTTGYLSFIAVYAMVKEPIRSLVIGNQPGIMAGPHNAGVAFDKK